MFPVAEVVARDNSLPHLPASWPRRPSFPERWPRPFGARLPCVSNYRRSRSRRKGPRSRAEIEAERSQLHDDTAREVDALIAEFHTLLPREQARAIGRRRSAHAGKAQA